MVIRKRILLWDWSNTSGPGNPGVPQEMNNVPFGGNSPMSSVINWNSWTPPELKGRAPFRPMVRTMGQASGGDWATIENTSQPLVLFFNEPERQGISPEQARDIWYRQMLPLRQHKGKKLGSPAPANDPQGQQWLERFMGLVARDPPDFLCLHYYSNNADAAIKYITDMHNKYRHPVMVTEIASIDRNYNNVLNFTIKICNWMDQQPWISEYGLFDFQRKVADGFVSPAAQLMAPNGHFTQLGLMYLHDQPMRYPAKPHAALMSLDLGAESAAPVEAEAEVQSIETEAKSEFVPPTIPGPAQHGPEDEIHHGPPAEPTEEDFVPASEEDAAAAEAAHPAQVPMGFEVQANLNPDQAAALKVHNDGRRAKGLAPLQWDNQLAAHAQQWANELVKIGHLQHSTGQQRPGQGENLAWAWASNGIREPLKQGAQGWMNEAKDYHGEKIGEGDFHKYGHYTQCMWRSTTKVGMAVARDSKGAAYTVGRYSPPGNWSGQKPY